MSVIVFAQSQNEERYARLYDKPNFKSAFDELFRNGARYFVDSSSDTVIDGDCVNSVFEEYGLVTFFNGHGTRIIISAAPVEPIVFYPRVWADRDYQGQSMEIDTNWSELQHTPYGDLNDKITSFIIWGGRAQFIVDFYENSNFGGQVYTVVGPAQMSNLDGLRAPAPSWPNGFWLPQDNISSIRITKNY